MAFLSRVSLPAHRKLERIVVQRLAAAGLDDDRGAELKPGFEVFGDWIRLDHVHHIFLQGPRFHGMSGATRAELGGFSRFAVEDAVIAGKAVVFDDRSCGDNLFAGGAGLANLADVLVALKRAVEKFSIDRRGLFADGEGAVDLR